MSEGQAMPSPPAVRAQLLATEHWSLLASRSLVTLFALVAANVANFMASAQAYSDPVLTLMTAFFVGCLFATATLDERVPVAATSARPALAHATA